VKYLHTWGRVATLATLCAIPVQLLAAEAGGNDANTFQYGLSAGATYSDNIARTSADKDTDTSVDAGFYAALRHDRGRLDASVNADLNYQARTGGDYPDSLSGGLAARAAYQLLHDRLTWVAQENLGQALRDSRDAATPGNSQNLNVFSTGPDIVLPLGARTDANLQGRWTDTSYEESDFGTRRLSGTIGLARQVGEHSSLSLNGSMEKTKYKELPSENDYETRSVYMGWSATGARTVVDFNVGYTRLEDQLNVSNGMTYSLGVQRELTSRSNMALRAGREFGDAADELLRSQRIRDVSIGDRPIETAADPRRSDYVTANWGFEGARSSLSLSGDWRRDVQTRSVDQNRRSLAGRLQLTRNIGPRLGVDFHTGYRTEDFTTASIEFDEWDVGVGVRWSVTRAMGLNLAWDHYTGDGDTSLGPDTRDFSENRISLRLTWSPER
jgi:hypothetical protein